MKLGQGLQEGISPPPATAVLWLCKERGGAYHLAPGPRREQWLASAFSRGRSLPHRESLLLFGTCQSPPTMAGSEAHATIWLPWSHSHRLLHSPGPPVKRANHQGGQWKRPHASHEATRRPALAGRRGRRVGVHAPPPSQQSSNTSLAHQLGIWFCSRPQGLTLSSQPHFRVSLILVAISFALVGRD